MTLAGAISPHSGLLLFKPHTTSIAVHRKCKTKPWFIKKDLVSLAKQSAPNVRPICASLRSGDNYGLSYQDGYDKEPFWLSVIKGITWSLRSLAMFLTKQPSQLKYLEWPTFQSTLRTSTLTLVLVALLIVALSSIDASLCYVLALLMRKKA